MTEREEMEALLRAKHPDYSDEHIRDLLAATISHPHARDAAENWRILAHLRAEKAAAYELGHSVGQHDATTGEDVRAAEAAALESASDALIPYSRETGSSRAHDIVASLMNSASRTALSERDARVHGEGRAKFTDELHDVVAALYKAWPDAEDMAADWPIGIIGRIEDLIAERDAAHEEGRKEGIQLCVRVLKQATDWVLAGSSAWKQKAISVITDRTGMTPHPAQGAEEGR
jgi:hypothetical protein